MLRSSVLAFALVACGPAPAPVTPVVKDDGVARFQAVEDDVLRELAASDRRFAARAQLEPREEDARTLTMGAMLAEDASLAVIDGAIDPFSFEARARGLDAAAARLRAAPSGLPQRAGDAAPAFEQELLGRLVDAERARLDEERALPRSASALVRALVATWQAPTTPGGAAERDRWLTRRLEEVLASLGGKDLDVGRARELDDALDPLEHAIGASALVHSTAALVRLRAQLEALATRPAAPAAARWTEVGRGVRAELGLASTPEALDARLEAAETALASQAAAATAASHVSKDVIQNRAAPLVFASSPCVVAVAGSRVRSLAPASERAPACRLRALLLAANDDAARAVALMVLHDHVIIARWALDVARGTATIAQTTARHRPLSAAGPNVIAIWERIALAQPTAAIGGGYAAALLGGRAERAQAWTELGEVPLDVVERTVTATQ